MPARSKKEMLIEEAQKSALRGQFDKAAKAYEQLLALEPSAVNLRQKLAELLIKCGRHEDARKEFETIGKHFSKNGFYLKSIAVYKQLQKLFPSDINLSLTLAELNEKHGLIANALTEYKIVYDYYEKAENVTEALGILDKMQKVDAQNIPIKLKLAEAYAQQGKNDEAYTVLGKAASLLLERGDTATFLKICSRSQQLFSARPNLMYEVLAERLALGGASAVSSCLQGVLRSNPANKRAWELIVQAYQQLDQPERVRIACQHYLKFFPSEPAAMLALISAFAAEQNLAQSLALLDQYETVLIESGFLQQLEAIYRTLDKIDPISTRVLEGFIGIAAASGNENEVLALKSKLQSIRSIGSGLKPHADQVFADVDLPGAVPSDETTFFGDSLLEGGVDSETPPPPSDFFAATLPPEIECADASALPEQSDFDSDLEVEIDLDLDAPFGATAQDIGGVPLDDNWLDSVGDLFNSIDTAPSGVKFGNEMESADARSHFDLGQAFKEMGLYDEAINEFRQASQDATIRVVCLIMQCTCLRERGELEKAVTMLQALLKPGLSEEESCSVKYELAFCYEAMGKNDEANILLNEINATNPGFRDISSRLDRAEQSESLDFSDEDLDDFDFK